MAAAVKKSITLTQISNSMTIDMTVAGWIELVRVRKREFRRLARLKRRMVKQMMREIPK